MRTSIFAATFSAFFAMGCGGATKKDGDAAPEDPTPGETPADAGDDGTDDGGADPGPNPGPNPNPGPKPNPNPKPPAAPDPFAKVVEPTQASVQANLINPYCTGCHAGATPAAGLNLTDLGIFLAEDGSSLGRGHRFLIIPGKPELSLLVRALDEGEGRMPPANNQLGVPAVKPAQKAALEAWIKAMPAAELGGVSEP